LPEERLQYKRLLFPVIHSIPRRLGFWLAALWASVLLLSAAATSSGSGDPLGRSAVVLLRDECFSCHGETKQKAGLSLLTREQVLKGSEEGQW